MALYSYGPYIVMALYGYGRGLHGPRGRGNELSSLRRIAWAMACSMAYGLQHGLWPTARPMAYTTAYGLQHGLQHDVWPTARATAAAWPMASSMAYILQHGLRPAAWTTACSIGYGLCVILVTNN